MGKVLIEELQLAMNKEKDNYKLKVSKICETKESNKGISMFSRSNKLAR